MAALKSCRSCPQSRSMLRCFLSECLLAVAAWPCVIGGVDLGPLFWLRRGRRHRYCSLDLAANRLCLHWGNFAFSCHCSAPLDRQSRGRPLRIVFDNSTHIAARFQRAVLVLRMLRRPMIDPVLRPSTTPIAPCDFALPLVREAAYDSRGSTVCCCSSHGALTIENRYRIQHREGRTVPLPEIRGRRVSFLRVISRISLNLGATKLFGNPSDQKSLRFER